MRRTPIHTAHGIIFDGNWLYDLFYLLTKKHRPSFNESYFHDEERYTLNLGELFMWAYTEDYFTNIAKLDKSTQLEIDELIKQKSCALYTLYQEMLVEVKLNEFIDNLT